MLPGPDPRQRVQPVAGRNTQVIQSIRCIQVVQFPQRTHHDVRRETLVCPRCIQLMGVIVGERFNHAHIVIRHVTRDKTAREEILIIARMELLRWRWPPALVFREALRIGAGHHHGGTFAQYALAHQVHLAQVVCNFGLAVNLSHFHQSLRDIPLGFDE